MDYSSSMPGPLVWKGNRASSVSDEDSQEYEDMVDIDLMAQGHNPQTRIMVENMLQSICLVIYDIYNRSVQLTDTIDNGTSLKKYAQRTRLTTSELQSRLRRALDQQIEFVEKIDDEHRAFLKLPSYTENIVLEAESIPIFKQVWFGDYFEATGIDSLAALKTHLVGIHDQLDLGHLVKKIEKQRD